MAQQENGTDMKNNVYVVSNETDRVVESIWSSFEGALKECKKLEVEKPREYTVVKVKVRCESNAINNILPDKEDVLKEVEGG